MTQRETFAEQLNFFGIWDQKFKNFENNDPSWFAKVFLNLYLQLYEVPGVQQVKQRNLYNFVQGCTNYERQLYCEWILHYSREWEADIGSINRDRLQSCISDGGVLEYLSYSNPVLAPVQV